MLRAFFALLVFILIVAAFAVALAAPRPQAGIDEKLGITVPLDTVLRDEADQPITLRQCIGDRPTILVPMYYRCPMNCNLVLQNLVESIRAMPADFSVGKQFNIVCVSFDPKEHGSLAAAKKEVTLGEYGRPGAEAGWRFLTGTKDAIAEVMSSIGYQFEFDKAYKEYNHPNAIIVLSPEGKTTRYFYGFNYSGDIELKGEKVKQADGTEKVPTTTLRLSLIEAAGGKGGSVLDKLTLLCYRFDHLNKGYSVNVLRVVQLGGILTLLLVTTGVGLTLLRERRAARAAGLEPHSEPTSEGGTP
jgi:protein SCO1/2